MTKITYTDKVAINPSGTAINQVQDVDMNEIKTAVNDNDTAGTGTGATVVFDKPSVGRIYGTLAVPITVNLIIDNTGAENNGFVEIIWSGSAMPTITGVTNTDILHSGNVISEAGTYSIFILYSGGKYKVFISDKYAQYDTV